MLPKSEWRLLVRYYQMAEKHPRKLISFPHDYLVSESEAEARDALLQRGLLDTEECGYVNRDMLDLFNLPYLRLTLAGEDKAREYSSWFWRTGLLWDHLKHHWLITGIAFVAGIGVTILVQWITRKW